jgi:hypothetical protein
LKGNACDLKEKKGRRKRIFASEQLGSVQEGAKH